MARSARKEREIQEREERILDVGRRLLLEEGFSAISMDRIAAEIEYSKGTVYQHFTSKEDVLAALAVQTHEKRTALFERAATFQGRARERIMAIGVAVDVFVRLHPAHFQAEQIILLTADPERMGSERLRECYSHESRCFEVCCGIVRDGIAAGDLELKEPMTPETVTYGLWAISFGANYIARVQKRFKQMMADDAVFVVLGMNVNSMLDGIGFAPMFADHDYEASIERIGQEVFPDEIAQLRSMNG